MIVAPAVGFLGPRREVDQAPLCRSTNTQKRRGDYTNAAPSLPPDLFSHSRLFVLWTERKGENKQFLAGFGASSPRPTNRPPWTNLNCPYRIAICMGLGRAGSYPIPSRHFLSSPFPNSVSLASCNTRAQGTYGQTAEIVVPTQGLCLACLPLLPIHACPCERASLQSCSRDRLGGAPTCKVRISWPWPPCRPSCQVRQQSVGMHPTRKAKVSRATLLRCYSRLAGLTWLQTRPRQAEPGVRLLHSTTKDTRGSPPPSLRGTTQVALACAPRE
ncbi:hypothetical protein MAPG_05840 [Magnaporthiopsis poae ATCC 64411]|uniref:Uncharacterized protein n=1 Tax=Magnaporthiopsis poae (strain ATCC 64411 / 73-15) TaxID=644358 RepID=A0A0C4E0G6_MAGP6|nr:hypothetical protein MAPG_05840 [Magnaporthiopsis poae ATCC 64411]